MVELHRCRILKHVEPTGRHGSQAVGDDVPKRQGRDVSQIGIEDLFAGPEVGHDLSDLEGIPYQGSI